MVKTLIVASRLRELCIIGERELSTSADLTEALTKKVEKIIEEACVRADANGRFTVMGRDL